MDQFCTTINEFYNIYKVLWAHFNVLKNPSMFHIGFIDVQLFLENDQDKSKLVGVTKNFVWKYNFNIIAFVGFVWIIY